MSASRTARERVRAELTREIIEIARGQLAREGAAGLSLRAVAREMGMVSSAMYRYFASRDELLTALIVDGYNAIGAAVERAEAVCARDDHMARWFAVCHAVRDWALAHPHEYALLYGSPVPGYQAPQDTIGPALRDSSVYGRVVADAYAAGAIVASDGLAPVPASFAADADRIREVLTPGVPDDVTARAVGAWAGVFGAVSFELFGQFNNALTDPAGLFHYVVACLAHTVGLRDAQVAADSETT